MTIEPCGPDCVAEQPLLDTADGREHDNCPDTTITENPAVYPACVFCGEAIEGSPFEVRGEHYSEYTHFDCFAKSQA